MATIAALTVQHLDAIMAIEQATNPAPWTKTLFADAIASSKLCLGLYANQALCGYIVMQAVVDEAELLLLAVSTSQQRKGYAQLLVNAAIAQLPHKVQSVFLEVRASNNNAIALYDKLGFNQIGLRPKYYAATAQGKAEDAVIMAKELMGFTG